MRRFDIIGAGMGTRETLTGEAAQTLVSAEMVFATERLAEICENAQICLFISACRITIQYCKIFSFKIIDHSSGWIDNQ